MRSKQLKLGMTLVETMVAIAIFSIISTALISMAVTTLSAQQSAKLKNLATRCAEGQMEKIKSLENANRSNIQKTPSDWSWFPSGTNCAYNTNANFFVTTLTNAAGNITVSVTWNEKGQTKTVTLVTKITKWL
ncbi:MAG: type II secretion system protein [bacterium]|nr:type II secretion system protein [bacterium]